MPVQIDTVLLKAASRCNLNCAYCYVYNMGSSDWISLPKIMEPPVLDAVVDRLRELRESQDRGFAVVLHGGEPLLLGLARLRRLLNGLREALSNDCTISIQTNGTLITDEVLDLCLSAGATIAVSLDGPPWINDRFRVGFRGEGTFERVVEGILKAQQHADSDRIFSGTLSVIDPQSDPVEIYRFFKELGVPSMDFLLRDGNHDRYPPGKCDFESNEYGMWMASLFDAYLEDADPVPIRVFDDIVRLTVGAAGCKEGLGLQAYGILIVDTDGSIKKNDTLKSSYQGADRFRAHWTILKDSLLDVAESDEFFAYANSQQPTSHSCSVCPILRICGGGMPLYRWSTAKGYDNPSVFCADHRHLIGHVQSRLREMIR